MYLPASLAMLFTLLLLALSASAQLTQAFANSLTDSAGSSAIHGTVLEAEGHPASGVHIELDEAGTAVPVASTSTQGDGTFELYNIPEGSYEVVAESTNARADASVHIQRGESQLKLVLQRTGNTEQSLSPTVSVAQMMVPESAEKLFRKARTFFEHRKCDKAKSLLDNAVQLDPQFAQALTLRAQIEMSQGDLPSAQRDLESAVKIDPNYGSAYISLGAVYNHQGRFDDAMRVAQRSLVILPKSWQGYFEMAKASVGKGMYEKGLQLAAQAQRLSGNSFATVHLIKAYALVPMRLYKEARYELQAFLSREPNSSGAEQAQMLLAEIDSMPSATLPVQ